MYARDFANVEACDSFPRSFNLLKFCTQANPNCLLVVTPYGGHLGWVAGPEAPFGCPWTDPLAMQYLEALEEVVRDSAAFAKAHEDDGDVEVASMSSRKRTEKTGLME